jgi:hypothetical protein
MQSKTIIFRLKCGHLSNNESIAHCFMREMQLIELKQAIVTAMEEESDLMRNGAVIGEFRASKVSFVSRVSCKPLSKNYL